ncbi:MAG TPA: putative LPS assembly protein LptD [Cyclobacteriaceae bacterium]|nr:putative LPS assembly protein LptD [Cyclobacteriaceae bacterium]
MNFSLNDKQLTINSEVVKLPALVILTVVFSFVSISGVNAQVEKPVRPPRGQLPVRPDTIRPPLPDSLQIKNDTLSTQADSVKAPPEQKDIETTIFYSARDSINSNMKLRIIKLYGDAKIKYGSIELEAEEIIIDYNTSTITANGTLDSLGRRVGAPIFKDGGSLYETRDMVYNFKTKRAKISEVVTTQGDGFIHGDKVYKNNKNELFSINNAYTTCNLAHPHFRIISRKSKAIPGDKIVSGPFYMEFMDVPTPLGFAFGIFPQTRKSASGILMPTYGEEKTRGFFLKNGGYYFDISDYVKLGITGDLYSKGSSAMAIQSQYKKRYKYTGSVAFNFTNNRLSQNVEDNLRSKDFRLVWSHSPQTKGTGRFSASVNAATSSFTTNNYVPVNSSATSSRLDATTRKLSSTVSYSKTFAGTPFNVGVNLRHSQDLFTKQVDLPMPDISFNMNNVYPFKNSQNTVLQNLAFRLTTNATNFVTNNLGPIKKNKDDVTDSIAPFSFQTLPTFFKNAEKGVKHNFPLGTSIKILRYFTLSPALTYDETWYFEKLEWGVNEEGTNVEVIDTVKGFNRISNYSGSATLTTRIYGTWVNKNKDARVKALRHVINPSVSYSVQPDFAADKYGYYQNFRLGNTIYQKSRHDGFVYGSSRAGRQGQIGFSLGNTLEMKIRGEKDTIDRKISLLNSLSISSGYNLLADSFKLQTFSVSANTNVLDGKINLNVSGLVDPYQYILTSINENGFIQQRKIDRFVWQDGGFKIGQLSSVNFNFSTNLSPKGRDKDNSTRDKIAKADISPTDKEFLMKNPDVYVDFDIPWNLRINYTVDYSKPGYLKPTITQAIRFNGDLSVTEKWKVDFNSGFDFQSKKFTQSQFGIRRDLHCWQVSLSWVPFGRYQNYNFSIGIKSGMLRDLKLDRQRTFLDQL